MPAWVIRTFGHPYLFSRCALVDHFLEITGSSCHDSPLPVPFCFTYLICPSTRSENTNEKIKSKKINRRLNCKSEKIGKRLS